MYPAYTQLVAKCSSPSIGDQRATGCVTDSNIFLCRYHCNGMASMGCMVPVHGLLWQRSRIPSPRVQQTRCWRIPELSRRLNRGSGL